MHNNTESFPEYLRTMTIGLMRIEIFISDANNLKDKRGVMRSLIDNVRRKFNVSVMEEGNVKWRRGIINVVHISTNRAKCNSALNKVIDFLRTDPRVEIINYNIELL